MTTKPELELGSHLVPGVLAVALFAVMSAVFVTASFGDPTGFGQIGSVTANIGYALFDLSGQMSAQGEGFLAAFEIIDLVLVAALVGAVMLARREIGGVTVTALRTDSSVESESDAVADGGTE